MNLKVIGETLGRLIGLKEMILVAKCSTCTKYQKNQTHEFEDIIKRRLIYKTVLCVSFY